MLDQKTVLLRPGASGKSQSFEAGHAKRLLAYPKTEWQEVADEAAPKPEAAAGAKKPAAAAKNLPEADATGHPTSI